MKDDLLAYYDDIRRLSEAKCATREDAEDLLSETFLAAYSLLHRGGNIEHPKTWLANTLMHKYHSTLRKKYRQPTIIEYDTLEQLAAEEDDFDRTEEAAQVRKKLLYLSQTTREVLIRFYYNGYSVSEIATQLGIAEGTVKSRLSAGREKIKKGLADMVEKKYNIPSRLSLSWSGSDGPNHQPVSLVEDDLIAQNLLIIAYDKPFSITELAEAIGIPTVYIEPIVTKLTEGELMVKTEGEKYYTDFIIYKPEDELNRFDSQLKFAEDHFESFWSVISQKLSDLNTLQFSQTLNVRQRRKLERYVALRILQKFQLEPTDPQCGTTPKRLDGGAWIALGWAFPAGYDAQKYRQAREYVVSGGHRGDGGACNYCGATFLKLFEFDTPLWDNPYRFGTCGFDVYFKEIRSLLWCIYKDIPFDVGNISNTMIESIDKLINSTGLITRQNGKLEVDIPVMKKETYRQIEAIIHDGYKQLYAKLGENYLKYLQNEMLEIPKHIKSIKPVHRYLPATNYIVMAVIRQAYDRGLHLSDVDYCCPPVVLVYEE